MGSGGKDVIAARVPEGWHAVDPKDESTPDNWVKRHPSMVRLTGRHPFNVEPPLPDLMRHGHQTPACLHYVRNHGAVPVKFASAAEAATVRDEWRVTVKGSDGTARAWSMADLAGLPWRELPVLLVCAGNRRKEQNMIKRTIGFNWGAAGLGMSTWGGCYLADVLLAMGAPALAEDQDGLHVRFQGPDAELPGGPDGSYGTSVPLRYAMDKSNEIIVAWSQNGEALAPDHGFPVRLIIPGYIGGRMVKWLKFVEIASSESDNFYHFKDNRVLPVNVTPEAAEADGWWFKPDFIINQLNINSAIASPAHDEVLPLATAGAEYEVKGYAYSGGGRKIIRVEVSLDGGSSWTLITDGIEHPPDTPTKSGKYWGWCMWKLSVPLHELLGAKSVMCRAWDAAMNTQPREPTWNVMGMLNNPWFTVLLHTEMSPQGVALHFEHPTMPGQEKGGWMSAEARQLNSGGASAATATVLAQQIMHTNRSDALAAGGPAKVEVKSSLPAASLTGKGEGRTVTLAELALHDKAEDCWIAIDGVVYDTTQYLTSHPGGGESILMNAGQDASDEFNAIHSAKARTLLGPLAIGVLVEGGVSAVAAEEIAVDTGPPVALDRKARVALVLTEREALSADTYRLRFALPSDKHVLGLPVGKHALVYGKDVAGKLVARAYTPVTANEVAGYVDFVIKCYRPLPPRFPAGGSLSQFLCDRSKIGDKIEFRGPLGEINYVGDGNFEIDGHRTFNCKVAGLISGGTGITPMLQLITAVLAEKRKGSTASPLLRLLYGNQTEADILCRDQLEQARDAGAVDLWYTLDRPAADWKYDKGFITDDMLKARLPPCGPDTYVFCCGPPPMIGSAKTKLVAMGYREDQVLCF